MNLQPDGPHFSGNGSHTLTVTSTDAVGYLLYAHTTNSTSMVNGAATIPASNNGTESALATNSWGYNTTGSPDNFLGMSSANALIKDASGPYAAGDNTTVTYGARTSASQEAGAYAISVTYTVVAKNE